MRTIFDEIKVSSKKEFELIDITRQVKESIKRSGVKNGFVIVFSQHTTGAVKINEYEKSLMGDFHNLFEKIAPKDGDYAHNRTNVDGRINAHSHLQSMLSNSGEIIPLKGGEMMLGTWQTIFFIEFDGARPERKVIVEVVGE